MKIIVIYGGTEWAADPVAWYGDPDDYLPYMEEARKIMESHPNIDMVRVGCVGDVGNFLDTTTDFDMSVIGEFEGRWSTSARSGKSPGCLRGCMLGPTVPRFSGTPSTAMRH